jgi:SAM-dependent methyltransferase
LKESRFRFKLKGLLLKIIGYKNPHRYWNLHWRLSQKNITLDTDKRLYATVEGIMQENHYENILDVGCGRAYLRALKGYLGLDWSMEAIKNNGLEQFLIADITNRIPLPDETLDCTYVSAVLGHIPPDKIERAVAEISRVTRYALILNEERTLAQQTKPHVFSHDLETLVKKHFRGQVFWLI